MGRILIVDNDEGLVHFLKRLFLKQGHDVYSCADGISGLQRVKSESFDLVLLDYKMPGLNGLETLREIKRAHIKTPVIVMTAYGTTETAIDAMRLGAYDYLLKPFDTKALKQIASDALEVNRLMKEMVSLPSSATPIMPAESPLVRIVGTSPRMQKVFKLIGQVVEKDVTVLITGESGTGKELVARAIYHHSHRSNKPFMAVNCASIPDTLFESELFGYERGAFTGAYRSYVGKFERCHGGTLFFDEIGDMSPGTQAKVLRVLQEGEFERLGGAETIRVDVRILAATNKNLEDEVKAGRFRADLYYRLKVISIDLPPLRERMEDLPSLVEYFVSRFSQEYGRSVRYVADPTIRKLQSMPWPGNVRQLENHLRRAVLVCRGDVLLPEHVESDEAQEESGAQDAGGERAGALRSRAAELAAQILPLVDEAAELSLLDLVEEALVAQAMKVCENNQVRAARLLGISRNTLRHRIRRYNLMPPESP
ncbi:MAG: sigma-54-dependent Fis family transcriptional regulator [Planctomycetes bacterium]|nr:sigma-54-dependent Fis family transcriptional regulator [Planctomycetota bacterium]